MACCDPQGYRKVFGPRFARHVAARYRRRGLDRTATRMVSYLAERGVVGASILEIGGGVGDIQIELLRRGAGRSTNLELVDTYDAEAAGLAATAGMSDRMTRRRLDIAATPDAVEMHDIVVMHRVVCCYPDYQRLLKAAADHAARLLVFSHPPRNWVSRLAVGAENFAIRLSGGTFQSYTHPPQALVEAAEGRGLRADFREHGLVWRVVGLSRDRV
jgi:2-polyprenyl-3-methyl-5-hydroxy-6-metoxy-1,4-benzoquinol methylase